MEKTTIKITDEEYKKIAQLVYSRFGINLGSKKQSLVMNRLNKVLIEKQFTNFAQFYSYILNDRSGLGLDTLINKISTNLTYFGRENEHFDFLKNSVIPSFLTQPDILTEKSIRVWCAGCSTGEEAYTVAFILKSFFKTRFDWHTGVLATDISARALNVAKQGIYSNENVEKLEGALKKRAFLKSTNLGWQIHDEIKNIVLFRRLNLMRKQFPFKRKFHAIFCRNVMIYFDHETRESLMKKFHIHLADGGYLFIGHSESFGRNNPYFRYIRPAVYQKV